MQTDVSTIKYDPQTDLVSMPLAVYEELRMFARQHGETDLPWLGKATGGFKMPSDDEMRTSASMWPGLL